MKNSVLLFFLFLTINIKAQSFRNNLFKDINYSILDSSNNIIVHYTLTNFCAENIENLKKISPIIQANRNKFKFILIFDTATLNNKQVANIIANINPDLKIILNQYFLNGLSSKKELKKFTKDFDTFYNTKTTLLGPTTTFIIGKGKFEIIRVDDIENKIANL